MAEVKTTKFDEGVTTNTPDDSQPHVVGDPDGSNVQHAVTINYLNTYDQGKRNNLDAVVDPTASDDGTATPPYEIGSLWYNSTASASSLWVCEDASTGAAVWREMIMDHGAQTIAGTKTFSSPLLVSDTTDSTTKDTGSIITEGGIGVEKNIHVGGNATIDGNLTISGTTTTVNTSVLDVEDANITVNNGGNDASSEGAGITIERTSTNGSIAYEDALTSKFKVGASGSEVEVADISSAQVITNKDIDGGTAANNRRITLPKDTKTNLDALTRKEATLLYASDEDVVYKDDGTTLTAIGTGSTSFSQNEVRLVDANGHGSTDTQIRRFNSTAYNIGSAFTVSTTAANGSTITINEKGVYAISYCDGANASQRFFGVTLNSAQLTTQIFNTTKSTRLLEFSNGSTGTGTDQASSGAWVGVLDNTDVIRAHTDGFGTDQTSIDSTMLTITKIVPVS
jgi:hypothetical protein